MAFVCLAYPPPIQSLALPPPHLPLPLPVPPPLARSRSNRSKQTAAGSSHSHRQAAMDAAEARRSSSASSSPEFEFWPLHPNPAASPSCADELFAGGVLLPLPVLPPKPASRNSGIRQGVTVFAEPEPEPEPELGEASLLATVAQPTASITSPAPPTNASGGGGGSKRWTDIFSKKPAPVTEEKEKEKRKDGGAGSRKQGGHSGGAGSELNINIWPFSRSRSAGGGSGSGSGSSKPRPAARKVSSAPCSRSNSRGEAGAGGPPLRRWAASPGRSGGGVPVGRSSPVWQIRRPPAKPAPVAAPAPVPVPSASEVFTDRRAPPPQQQQHKEKPAGAANNGRKPGLGSGVRGLNLSVNSCIGYRHQVSCRRADVGAARGPGGGGLFGIKGLFSKKVH